MNKLSPSKGETALDSLTRRSLINGDTNFGCCVVPLATPMTSKAIPVRQIMQLKKDKEIAEQVGMLSSTLIGQSHRLPTTSSCSSTILYQPGSAAEYIVSALYELITYHKCNRKWRRLEEEPSMKKWPLCLELRSRQFNGMTLCFQHLSALNLWVKWLGGIQRQKHMRK